MKYREMEHFKTLLIEYPFSVRFEGELAVDMGGVSRDLFFSFLGMCIHPSFRRFQYLNSPGTPSY